MSRTIRHRTSPAFTLIEMVAVIVVMGILVAISAFWYASVRSRVDASTGTDTLRNIAAAEQLHYRSRGEFVAATDTSTPTTDQLNSVADNKQGYTGPDTQPSTSLQVSVSHVADAGGVPVIGLATMAGTTCVVLAAYAPDSAHNNMEGTYASGSYQSCTGDAALTLLHAVDTP